MTGFRLIKHSLVALIVLTTTGIVITSTTGVSTAATEATGSSTPTNKGLYITPVRQFITMKAGSSKSANITVGNFTDNPMVVSFSVKHFSVSDYSYNFKFETITDNNVSISNEPVRLKPSETKTIPFNIAVPAGNPPGGQYYTLFATGQGETGSAAQQVQATSVLYLTVDGELRHSGSLVDSSISRFAYRSDIPFSLDIENTGNTHYFVFINGKLAGPLTGQSKSSEAHLLLPSKTRHFESTIPAPKLPGIYRAVYGYSSDFSAAQTRTSYIVYIPPWSLAGLVLVAWAVWAVRRRLRKHRQQRAVKASNKDDGSPAGN